MGHFATEIDAVLSHLRGLPFVDNLRLLRVEQAYDRDDGVLEVTTPGGPYRLSVEYKRSSLNQSVVNGIISRTASTAEHPSVGGRAANVRTAGCRILLARYIPVSVGEQLVNAGICFADEPGNVHLRLGSEYNWTVLGKKEPPRLPEANRTTPATVQLLFQLATNPEASNWTVRDLARATGISKSNVAQLRNQFLAEGVLTRQSGLQMTPELSDRMIAGYSQILRPKLIAGRYRYADASAAQLLKRLARTAKIEQVRYALTGAPAAAAMQHFYHGTDVSVFMDVPGPELQRGLRLLPDRTGTVLLLKPFGELVFWKEFEGMMVAPPWLVYAELLASGDARAREAAEEVRRGFLQ